MIPIGTSMSAVLATLPTRLNTFVPLLRSVPIPENHSLPRDTITGTVAHVSTLLMHVGLPHSPFSAG